MDIVKVTNPWYKCDRSPKITENTSLVVIIAYVEEPNNKFVEIRVNIKHDLTGLMDERGTGNSDYHWDQII